jgi:hypothetical protein
MILWNLLDGGLSHSEPLIGLPSLYGVVPQVPILVKEDTTCISISNQCRTIYTTVYCNQLWLTELSGKCLFMDVIPSAKSFIFLGKKEGSPYRVTHCAIGGVCDPPVSIFFPTVKLLPQYQTPAPPRPTPPPHPQASSSPDSFSSTPNCSSSPLALPAAPPYRQPTVDPLPNQS